VISSPIEKASSRYVRVIGRNARFHGVRSNLFVRIVSGHQLAVNAPHCIEQEQQSSHNEQLHEPTKQRKTSENEAIGRRTKVNGP
jgi:hypothetical protein